MPATFIQLKAISEGSTLLLETIVIAEKGWGAITRITEALTHDFLASM